MALWISDRRIAPVFPNHDFHSLVFKLIKLVEQYTWDLHGVILHEGKLWLSRFASVGVISSFDSSLKTWKRTLYVIWFKWLHLNFIFYCALLPRPATVISNQSKEILFLKFCRKETQSTDLWSLLIQFNYKPYQIPSFGYSFKSVSWGSFWLDGSIP